MNSLRIGRPYLEHLFQRRSYSTLTKKQAECDLMGVCLLILSGGGALLGASVSIHDANKEIKHSIKPLTFSQKAFFRIRWGICGAVIGGVVTPIAVPVVIVTVPVIKFIQFMTNNPCE